MLHTTYIDLVTYYLTLHQDCQIKQQSIKTFKLLSHINLIPFIVVRNYYSNYYKNTTKGTIHKSISNIFFKKIEMCINIEIKNKIGPRLKIILS